MGLRQMEKHGVVLPLFHCHKFYTLFALEYIRLGCVQIRKAFYVLSLSSSIKKLLG